MCVETLKNTHEVNPQVYLILPHEQKQLMLILMFVRRVHITDSVLACLNGDYEVEDGHGQDRDAYLKQYKINTYLIVAEHPRV